MEEFIEELKKERKYSEEKWGDEFNKKNTANDWVNYIVVYLGQASHMPWDEERFKQNMLKVANLASLAYEKSGSLPKRHYD
jgi:hypothetical protein